MCLGVYPHDLDAVSPRLMVSVTDSATRVDVELGHHVSYPIADEGQDERTLAATTDAEGSVDAAASLSTDACEPPAQSSSSTSAVTSDSTPMTGFQSTNDTTFRDK